MLSLAVEDRLEEVNSALTPSAVLPDILYEDKWILAVNKPPFMPTHPSAGHQGDTLANAVAGYFAKQNIPFIFRTVNRLDRDTSGIVLLSKDKHTAALLSAEMERGQIQKSYLALLRGNFPSHLYPLAPDAGRISTYLRRKEGSRMLRETFTEPLAGTASAVTDYRVLSHLSIDRAGKPTMLTWVRALPKTGRTHQLRVQFAFCGHPILGDSLYGQSSDLISRQALHAETLTFLHPINKSLMTLRAPLPEDMQSLKKEFSYE